MRNVLTLLSSAMLVVVGLAAEADAGLFRSLGFRSSQSQCTSQRQVTPRSVAKSCRYPRLQQVDGKTLWDLGKQNGQWPRLR